MIFGKDRPIGSGSSKACGKQDCPKYERDLSGRLDARR
jgi:hypothetical protein